MRMICTVLFSALLVGPVLAQSGDGSTKHYGTKGFSANVHVGGTSWKIEEDDLDIDDSDGGPGGGLALGYGVSDLVSLFLSFDGSEISQENDDSYTLAHGDLGARFNFGSGQSPARPYALIALSVATAEFDRRGADLEISGPGLTIGGGILYFVSEAVAINAGPQLTFGNLSDVKVGAISIDPDISFRTFRFSAGVEWWP